MILANKDEDIKYLNAAVIVKAKEYNIDLDSFNTVLLIDNDNIKDKASDVASSLNVEEWFNNTINCMDISAGCIACDTAQSNYSKCAAGCFTANARCDGCEGQDAVCIQCVTEQSENCNQTTIVTCLSCDDGCHWCDGVCHGCNHGCQGAQTCQSCNVGEGCTEGCQGGGYTAGCDGCNDTYNPCVTGHIEACDWAQATFGCIECVSACVGNNTSICEEKHIENIKDPSLNNPVTCTSNNASYKGSDGCTNNNISCELLFTNGGKRCDGDFTSSSNFGTIDYSDGTCPSKYQGCVSWQTCVTSYSCYNEYGSRCYSGFKWTNNGNNETGNRSCESGYSGTTQSCESFYSSSHNDFHCSRNYSEASTGTLCPNNFSATTGFMSCSGGYSGADGSTCRNVWSWNPNDESCVSAYQLGSKACDRNFRSETIAGVTLYYCESHFSDSDTVCDGGYTIDTTCTISDNVCLYNFSDTPCGQSCTENHNNIYNCTGCNNTKNDVCLNCVGGQAEQCNVCFGIGDIANCTACVAGVGETCTTCVDGNGGCLDCQGCNEGCNNNVSCQGYSAQSGYDVCLGQFTDTTCRQSCYNIYDGQTDCLGCDGCQGCDGCNATCYGCDACNTSCNSCESCYDTCYGCDGCNSSCETGQSGCTPCNSECYSCNTSCETCNDTCEGCNECNDSCHGYGSHCEGADWAACGQSVPCYGGYFF